MGFRTWRARVFNVQVLRVAARYARLTLYGIGWLFALSYGARITLALERLVETYETLNVEEEITPFDQYKGA